VFEAPGSRCGNITSQGRKAKGSGKGGSQAAGGGRQRGAFGSLVVDDKLFKRLEIALGRKHIEETRRGERSLSPAMHNAGAGGRLRLEEGKC